MHYSGEDIRRARKQHGLSQEAVAYRVGIEQTELSKIERGKRTPDPILLQRIAALLSLNSTESGTERG